MKTIDLDKELARLTASYEDQGYRVVVRPGPDDMPPFAKDFKFEMVCWRAKGGVFVSAKRERGELIDDKEIVGYAGIIDQQKDWRLDLYVLGPEKPSLRDVDGASELSEEEIEEAFDQATQLVSLGFLRPALITALGAFEASMRLRLRAAGEGKQAEWGTPFLDMFDQLFAVDVLSYDDYDKLLALRSVRNQLLHGFALTRATEGAADVEYLCNVGRRLVEETRGATVPVTVPVPA